MAKEEFLHIRFSQKDKKRVAAAARRSLWLRPSPFSWWWRLMGPDFLTAQERSSREVNSVER